LILQESFLTIAKLKYEKLKDQNELSIKPQGPNKMKKLKIQRNETRGK